MKSLVPLCALALATAVSACSRSDQLAKPAQTTTTSGMVNTASPCPPDTPPPPPPGSASGAFPSGATTGSASPSQGVGMGYTPPASKPCSAETTQQK